MPSFGAEYSSDNAYFIAGGKALELIKKFEDDTKNSSNVVAAIGKEYGAKEMISSTIFVFDQETSNPALIRLSNVFPSKEYFYTVNAKTPEGRKLQERLDDIPHYVFNFELFSKRLTGAEKTATNPDRLIGDRTKPAAGYFGLGHTENAATFKKYGDMYVIQVPRVVRGVFNVSAKKAPQKGAKMADGYKYEWFTPPDSTAIPYSKVIELQEKQKGLQTASRQVLSKITVRSANP
jgi:hypothetical protein